jgi:signal transduction histidine kinase
VTDTGSGIGSQDPDSLFQAAFTSALGRGSTGLGLSLCRNLMTQMHGDVWLSTPATSELASEFLLLDRAVERGFMTLSPETVDFVASLNLLRQPPPSAEGAAPVRLDLTNIARYVERDCVDRGEGSSAAGAGAGAGAGSSGAAAAASPAASPSSPPRPKIPPRCVEGVRFSVLVP